MVCAVGLCLAAAAAAPAPAAEIAIEGTVIKLRADRSRSQRVFVFESRDPRIHLEDLDPRDSAVALVASGLGESASSSGRIDLDPERWVEQRDGDRLVAWRYLDRTASRGGVRKAIWREGRFVLKARGPGWPWKPQAPQEQVWIHILTGDETLCAAFDTAGGSRVSRNQKGLFKARSASRPEGCLEQLCGNGIREAVEQCDDGNVVDDDGCSNVCTIGECGSPDFPTTYDALQTLVFDNPSYQCTNDACHGAARSEDLDLRAGASYDQVLLRLVPGDASASLIWQKIAERTLGAPNAPNAAMPIGASAVLPDQLEALALWIDDGAFRDAVVPGTDTLLGICLPPAAPPAPE